MKTFSTSGTGNQQTLSEIESDKMPIYDSVADAEADLANLSVGQIVATKDTGDELAHPVNVVESGNLHAVTSNAVASACPKYPDYANKITIAEVASWTATEDCYINYMYTGVAAQHIYINGNKVSVSDGSNNFFYVQFSGYAKKGDIITCDSALLGSNRSLFNAFKLR